MNIILISDDRLKVTLTDSDLNGYGIRIQDIDYDNTETRRVFWTILDQAKSETGFDAAISRIFIQIYPDEHGGCEMYVSRIGDRRTARKAGDRVKCTVNDRSEEEKSEYIYRFDKIDELLSACKTLKALGFSDRSTAYAENRETDLGYYLVIRSEKKWTLILSEHGERFGGRYGKWLINERCELICRDNAAEILSNL